MTLSVELWSEDAVESPALLNPLENSHKAAWELWPLPSRAVLLLEDPVMSRRWGQESGDYWGPQVLSLLTFDPDGSSCSTSQT